jgi:hypothetical protein
MNPGAVDDRSTNGNDYKASLQMRKRTGQGLVEPRGERPA